MPSPHDPSRHAVGPESRSAVGTAVVAVVAYELAAEAVNQFLDGDVVPSLMPRIEAMTPRSVARAVTPQWTRYAGWIAVGAVYTLGVRALRSALPAPLRR
ncbi:MAG: hypothetical protein KDB35_22320 [Acidimicrobiales bacterium]|nr:hypothetical protein [Acidimicrobiales bacterium]MCB1013711.1 hypothetical protein [Acidimicrobiales bacterium]MCB9371701.1 hypothetical protein [Microthrixaceae bacterium]